MASPGEVIRSILCYAISSSVMLVINKVTISYIPFPACVFFVQFLTTTIFVAVFKELGMLAVDDLIFKKAIEFMPYVFSFVLCIYFNGKVLQYCNVETLITFRACSPLCVSILDWLFLGRELPARRSLLALFGVLAGAVGYVLCDSEFQMKGIGAYFWVFLYLVVIVFEMTYAKHMITGVDFQSPVWGSVFYTNVLSTVPIASLAVVSGELRQLPHMERPGSGGFAMLVACCMLGVCMNWSGWNCRSKISAASYTLLGVACKLNSVLLNVLIWDKHATSRGVMWLIVCLVCSAFYQQAPLREESRAASKLSRETRVKIGHKTNCDKSSDETCNLNQDSKPSASVAA